MSEKVEYTFECPCVICKEIVYPGTKKRREFKYIDGGRYYFSPMHWAVYNGLISGLKRLLLEDPEHFSIDYGDGITNLCSKLQQDVEKITIYYRQKDPLTHRHLARIPKTAVIKTVLDILCRAGYLIEYPRVTGKGRRAKNYRASKLFFEKYMQSNNA